jgi:hypothetical protein
MEPGELGGSAGPMGFGRTWAAISPVPQVEKKLSCSPRVVAAASNNGELTMTKPPPVPPDNQSHKGTGDPKTGNAHQAQKGPGHIENPREQGQAGNIVQNTTHQGYQQDR